MAAGGRETVEVLVPKVSISRKDYTTSSKKSHGGVGDVDDDRDDRLSMQTKQMAMRRRAATLASLAADDYSRKLEQGDFTGAYPEGDLMRPGKHKGTHIAIEEALVRGVEYSYASEQECTAKACVNLKRMTKSKGRCANGVDEDWLVVVEQESAAEAWWAHNPQVPRSDRFV